MQAILLDCVQSNVLACIIFFCILLSAFLFLLICIRNPDTGVYLRLSIIILIVTGVEIVTENCLPEVRKIFRDFTNWGENFNNGERRKLPFVMLHLNACVYLATSPRDKQNLFTTWGELKSLYFYERPMSLITEKLW